MTNRGDEREGFARLILALEPYLADVVFAGGWAYRLLELHEFARRAPYSPLTTKDADIAAPRSLATREVSIRERLTQAGFREEFIGEDSPPVTHYHLGRDVAGFYAEFLTPLIGTPVRRDGTPDDTVEMSGVVAQKLRHIGILIWKPWPITLNESQGFPLGERTLVVRVANPVSFVVQKLLTLRWRKDVGKEVLYIFDTLQLFRDAFPQLRELYKELAPELRRAARQVDERRRSLFSVVTPPVTAAARIARSSGRPAPPSEELIQVACDSGLEAIFGA